MKPASETASYYLPVEPDGRRQQAVRWFWLSILSLLGAGVFSVLLVLARTPGVGEVLPYVDFFHTALVIHVNLSVLVWILAFAGVLWSLVARSGHEKLNQFILLVMILATLMMVVPAFLPGASPLMSNYIPVLDHPLFLAGLVLFGAGVGLQVLAAMTFTPPVGLNISREGVMRFGLNCAAISVIIALGCFAYSWIVLPLELGGRTYYELLFWGGGHVLQYTYTLLMMVCWLWLASATGIELIMSERVLVFIFLAGLISVFIAPLIYYAWHVTDPMHMQMFTWLMSFGGSLATLPLGLAVYWGLISSKPGTPRAASAHSALMTSLLLFGAGGAIGFIITGNDVTVPAHYHGCIVGVTLALMGVGYDVLPRLGFGKVNFALARIQLWTYAAGQFLHILGLVWSGGYGVERKVAGAAQGLDTLQRVAGMGLMGFGGLVSAIGGLLFIVIAWQALRAGKD